MIQKISGVEKSALLIVDLQNDFMPGGALAVPSANEIIPIINQLIPCFRLVIATQDWHPVGHLSFADSHPGKKVGDVIALGGIDQVLWPVHCVQGTKGAELVEGLQRGKISHFFYKGTDPAIDSYSAFFDNAYLKKTGLADFLKSREINQLFVVGVATDYCVLYSALDATELGFKVVVITDACRGIDLKPGDQEKSYLAMQLAGAKFCSSAEVFSSLEAK